MADEQSAEDKAPEAPQGSFEGSMQRLEDIRRLLEEGALSLDESLKLYEEGIRAFRACQKLLEEAELKVRKLVETTEGGLREEPFDAPGEGQ